MRGKKANWLAAVVFLIFGIFIGNRIGDALSGVAPFFSHTSPLALEPRTLTLLDFALTIGLGLKVNLAGAVGGLCGILLARRV